MIKELLKIHTAEKPQLGRPHTDMTKRLTKRHFPTTIADKEIRKCYVCTKTTKRAQNMTKRTKFECSVCNVGLCIDGCFESFHTHEIFQK